MLELHRGKIGELTDSDYERAFSLMSDQRKQAVMRLQNADDRKRTLLGELLARQAIAKALDVPEGSITFTRSERGKPIAAGLGIHFSIAHCNELVICAVSDKNIGADVEQLRPINLSITRKACSERDLEYVFGCAEGDSNEVLKRFFTLWTAKEAYFKFTGSGITDLKSVSCEDLLPHCRILFDGDYIITLFQT